MGLNSGRRGSESGFAAYVEALSSALGHARQHPRASCSSSHEGRAAIVERLGAAETLDIGKILRGRRREHLIAYVCGKLDPSPYPRHGRV